MTAGKPVLILGATSVIAQAVAASLARRGHALYLASRNMNELARIAADLSVRHDVPVRYGCFDADDSPAHADLVRKVIEEMGGLWGVIYAAGYMGETAPGEGQSAVDAAAVITRNLTGAVSVLEPAAAYLESQGESQGGGFILGISSVAGDRGRRRNYIYGSAKAGLTVYLQGLQHRMAGKGVRVVCVKPGLVDTPMTYGMKKGPLMASPEAVGERIARAAERGPTTVYVPFFWRPIMLVIRNLPSVIFNRMKF